MHHGRLGRYAVGRYAGSSGLVAIGIAFIVDCVVCKGSSPAGPRGRDCVCFGPSPTPPDPPTFAYLTLQEDALGSEDQTRTATQHIRAQHGRRASSSPQSAECRETRQVADVWPCVAKRGRLAEAQ